MIYDDRGQPLADSTDAKLLAYRDAVTTEMNRVYGISWHEANGDAEPLERAIVWGLTPEAFVAWWGDKYDLIPSNEW